MAFRTKIDFSSNRQVKQNIETVTVLSGGTSFGVTFNDLPSGPNLTTTAETGTLTFIASTFSGNSASTVYSWYTDIMELGSSTLSAITPTNSGMTQIVSNAFSATSFTTIDGNIVGLAYTGVNYDLYVIAMTDLGGGNYSGTVETEELIYLSADTLDFTGRTIWNDVSGITRTERLIVTNSPQVGYVLSCIDSEGMAGWLPSSGSSSLSYWSGGSGTNSVVLNNSNSVASNTNTIVIGANITGTTADTTYVDQLNIKTVGSSAFANAINIDANGNLTTNTSDERLKENIIPLSGALSTINALQGVSYQWKDRNAGTDAIKLGFIAQQVNNVDSRLVFTNPVDGFMGLHTDGIIPLLVEAVKELSIGVTTSNNTHLETQTILAEDNNIDLNYNGTSETALGGGITVLHAMGTDLSAQIITDENGNWVTNNDLNPKGLTIPVYTPISSADINGNIGNLTRDEDYLYLKTNSGWKRTNLESF